ncbi:translation initiation factor IF-3 [Clostridium collagenovorans DSM 3089]|uniref:Translation initiation factor IF-3 n=1 Tax=Clostridium collagenovorans DSM 3089 TaxID=1121306 RepID=A0A1M5VRY6_9CLOT|nr:translation initiation factor IF-3 [Clostridium collagenovorans]SHH78012.1 translation initiation factor IF-3 [Clostridium collagenovorans DSM 3089]
MSSFFTYFNIVIDLPQEVSSISTKKELLLNEEIRENEIRVIGDDGEQLGLMSSREALTIAEQKDLDLVMISPGANPPVCRIMDYGKHIYEQSKKTKEAKKNQKVVSIKEVRLSPTIEEHDINIKASNARKFLLAEDKVKVTVRFRGREADYSHVGKRILDSFYSKVEDVSSVEKPAKQEGRNMIMILAPKKAQ